MANDNTSNRGFASMSEEERREAARKGGKASHENRNQNRDNESRDSEGNRGGNENDNM